ncbi:MAG: STAS-like domain-containing protein [Vulcanimicrobiota bacterium]
METLRIAVFELVGADAAVTSEDGEILFERISKAFKSEKTVILDFNNIQLVTSTFLNAAIGQLYGIYEDSFIKHHLKQENMLPEDKHLLKKVIERAKDYFKNKDLIEKSIKGVLNNE